MTSVSNSNLIEPNYYHREYKHDVGEKPQERSLFVRGALASLPFISLYKPISMPLSFCMGSIRVVSNIFEAYEVAGQGNVVKTSCQLLQVVIAIIALAGTIIAHPLGILITTSHDIIIQTISVATFLQNGEYWKACESGANTLNNVLYLGMCLGGGLELVVTSLGIQIVLGLYHSQEEFRNGKWMEGCSHLLLSGMRGLQLNAELQTIVLQRKLLELKKTTKALSVLPVAGKAVSAPNQSTIYHSDETGELKNAFIHSIKEAKQSIVCLSFTFSDPEIINLLVEKANEGVQVTLIIDKDHMGSVLPYSSKFSLLTRTEGEGRLHHKIMVVDELDVWIGSANMSSNAFTKQENTMINLKNKEVATKIHEEMEVFLGIRERTGDPLPPISIGDQTVELLLFPYVPFEKKKSPEKEMNEYGKKRILQMINEAKSKLYFSVCVWTDPDLAAAAVNAKKRGVDVQAICWKEMDSAAVFALFKSEGIPVYEKPHLTLMHNKWMWVDDRDFFNGSANWSKSWFSRNDESAIILNNIDEQQKKQLKDYWEKLLNS